MKNAAQSTDQIRQNLLERCYNLGLPASSNDDIGTLRMYLDVDSKLDTETFDFHIENPRQRNKSVKSFIQKLFSK